MGWDGIGWGGMGLTGEHKGCPCCLQVALGLLVGMIVASSTFKTQCSQTCAPPVCPCFDVLPLVRGGRATS